MKIKNRILFHISRENNWKVEDKITSGERENPFWLKCKNYSPKINKDNHIITMFEMFDQNPSFEATQDSIDFLYQQLKNVSKETAFYIREQVFEEVRKEFYPQLPSRQKCLWLSEEDQLPYWKSIVDNEQGYLLTLELNGKVFCGDEYWLKADTFSSIEYVDRAKHYWSGELSSIPRKEYLFHGQGIIKEIISFQL